MRLLGRGGMGAVYLARECALDRLVAIKILPPETNQDEELRERFRREARVAAKLSHPNIVPLYTFGEAEGIQYFVMAYVKGETLTERLRREGALPEDEVRRILGELAAALDSAHQQGVIHRDIKPDNVLIEAESDRPLLADFGVSKVEAAGSTLTEIGTVLGTPQYMSPEQAGGQADIDGRSDLYSMGVMAYQMLTGRLPFTAKNTQDLLLQHLTQAPPALSALVPDAAPDLVEAISRCLEKSPVKRWDNGRQLRAAIEQKDDKYTISVTESEIDAVVFNYCLISFVVILAVFILRVGWILISVPTLFSLGVLIFGMAAFLARRQGLGWPAIRRRMLFPPRWWPCWWPKAWRRTGDIWERLPAPVRRVRTANGAIVLMGAAVMLTLVVQPALTVWAVVVALPSLVPWLFVILYARRWAGETGLQRLDIERLMGAPNTATAFWQKPEIQAILSPVGGKAEVSGEPSSPHQLCSAITKLVSEFEARSTAPVSEIAGAARSVVDLIVALDAEAAALGHDTDARELTNLEEQLRALGPEKQEEGEIRRAKRQLLIHQLDLHQRIANRLLDVQERRQRLLALLRLTWRQLGELRPALTAPESDDSAVRQLIPQLVAALRAQTQPAQTLRLSGSGS